MLESPNFLFVIEQSERDPANPGALRLTDYSLATRLSLLLWNAGPDDSLLDAAGSGKLHDPRGLDQQVQAMIASPRFEDGVRAFFSDMFGFSGYGQGEDFDNLAKDASIYPLFTGRSVEDAQEQFLKILVNNVIDNNGDYRDIFTTHTTYLSPVLAPLYGVPAPSSEWAEYVLPANGQREGILTQIGFLAVHAHPGRSSATRRGRALRELVLCENIPDPPPNVDFSVVEDPTAHYHTLRERVAAHSNDPGCAGCHKMMDPMGLSLENFDGAGQFRATENGAPIDASGALDGVKFINAAGLAEAVHDNPATTSCLVNRVVSYALGRTMTRKDNALLAYFDQRFAVDGYRVKALMRNVATSSAMSRVADIPLTKVSEK
jgi:hypothetical protein